MPTKVLSVISATALVINTLVQKGSTLAEVLAQFSTQLKHNQQAKLQAYCYELLRRYEYYDVMVSQLLSKPLKPKDHDIKHLMMTGLMLLNDPGMPAHAAIHESVEALKPLRKPWAKKLLNAILRRYQREQASLHTLAQQQVTARYNHPDWLLNLLQKAWPEHWQTIVHENLQHPPMALRVNRLKQSRDSYLQILATNSIAAKACRHTTEGIVLETPLPVEQLPLFAEGTVSVQDCAAQLAAELLAPQAGERILDACAAPGGKTLHLLEYCPDIHTLVAIDISAQRLDRVQQNLARLAPAYANTLTDITADATQTDDWWDGIPFDRILLDAPCSASGVIRRHPDIKRLRHEQDIETLRKTQFALLNALWPLLKSGGQLVYATCSVLPIENAEQIKAFLDRHNDAQCGHFHVTWGHNVVPGRQILPGEEGMDGFYYCTLIKQT